MQWVSYNEPKVNSGNNAVCGSNEGSESGDRGLKDAG